MSKFQIIDEKRYPLNTEKPIIYTRGKNINLPYHRWEHRVTLGYNGRTFMVFIDNGVAQLNIFPSIYIEEITASGLERIEDDNLFDDLYSFAQVNGFINMLAPMPRVYK